MKTLMIASTLTAVIGLTAAAQAQPGPRAGDGERGERGAARAILMLGAADYNGDNTVTRAEVDRLRSEEFAFRDRNGDGFLDLDDASPTRQRMAALRPENAERAGRGSRRGPGGMERLDRDGDARISRDEFVDRDSALFSRLDSNNDDAVSPDEIEAGIEARRARGGARREAMRWWRD